MQLKRTFIVVGVTAAIFIAALAALGFGSDAAAAPLPTRTPFRFVTMTSVPTRTPATARSATPTNTRALSAPVAATSAPTATATATRTKTPTATSVPASPTPATAATRVRPTPLRGTRSTRAPISGAAPITAAGLFSGTVPTFFVPGSELKAMVTDPVRNMLYIASKGNNNVVVWDQVTQTYVTSIGVDRTPWGIGYVNDRVFVGSFNSANVSVIDPVSQTRIKEIPLQDPTQSVQCAGQPANIAVHPFRNLVYVALYGNPGRVAVIDAVANSLVGCLEAGGGTFGVAVDPFIDRLYVTSRDAFNLMVFDVSSIPGSGLQTISLGGAPFFVQANFFNGEVYVMVANDTPDYSNANLLVVYSPTLTGLSLKTNVTVGNTDDGGTIWVSSFTGALYLAATSDHTLQLIDPVTYTVLQSIPMLDPYGIAENVALDTAYIGNRITSTVSVLPADLGP